MMRWLALFLLLLAGSAEARISTAVRAATANFNGDGWVNQCWSNFNVTNYLVQSNSFTTSPWVATSSGVSAPSVTVNTTDFTAPDGTNTATKVVLPAVNVGSGQQSYLIQYSGSLPNNYLANAPFTVSLWMRGAVGGEKVYLEFDDSAANIFLVGVTLSTTWQLYTLPALPTTNAASPFPGNSGHTGTANTPAETYYIWHNQVQLAGTPYSYIATTSSTGSATIQAACPPTVRFRDFRNLRYATAFQPLVLKGSQAWDSGFNPGDASIRPWQTVAGTYYGLFYGGTNSSCNTGPNCMISSWTGNDPFHLTDPGGSVNPTVQASSGQWDDNYLYTASWSPVPINGHTYAVFYGARSSGLAFGIGVATADSPTGPWTKYSSNPVVTGVFNPSVMRLPNGTLRMDSINQTGHWVMTQTSTNGLSWSNPGISLQNSTTSDWDNAININAEEYVWQNSHGFCEMMVMELGSIQEGAYAVAASCDPSTPAGQIWYRTPYNPGLTYPALSFPRATTGFGCPAVIDPLSRQGDMTVFICGIDSVIAPVDGGTWHATMPDY